MKNTEKKFAVVYFGGYNGRLNKHVKFLPKLKNKKLFNFLSFHETYEQAKQACENDNDVISFNNPVQYGKILQDRMIN